MEELIRWVRANYRAEIAAEFQRLIEQAGPENLGETRVMELLRQAKEIVPRPKERQFAMADFRFDSD